MAADRQTGSEEGGGGRGGDRRGPERRRTDRRSPPPVWRRAWALVAYGVVGTIVGMLLMRGLGDEPPPPPATEVAVAPPVAPEIRESGAAARAPVVDAYTTADFERLVLRGAEGQGQVVRAELFCSRPDPVALRAGVQVESAVAALRDENGRVPAAECKWGRRNDDRRPDFLLLVPPELADEFAEAPVVTDNFVRRRHLRAEVEWIGRAEGLSLRTAGVLRRIL